MSNRHTEGLRRLLKNIQDAKGRPQEVVEAALEAYDDALNALMPSLMAQCQVYWDMGNYHMVQRILRQSEEFCQENPIWQLNMAHAHFLMASQHCSRSNPPSPFPLARALPALFRALLGLRPAADRRTHPCLPSLPPRNRCRTRRMPT